MSYSSGDEAGRFAIADAPSKRNPRTQCGRGQFYNNITRRNIRLAEKFPSKSYSSSLESANIKSLRLFRHICRMMPFVLKIHQIQHQVTPIQSKRYIANAFRKNSKETDLSKIDNLIQYGYQTIYQAQMHYSNTGYLYRFIMPPTHRQRDHGVNKLEESRGEKVNKQPPTKFLQSFYKGKKSHYV